MAGHTARLGDRFSLVEGAKARDGDKAQYYPINPPQKDRLEWI